MRPAGPEPTPDDIRAMLKAEDKERLVEMIMERAADDEVLADRLVMKAASRRPSGTDMATLRRVISSAFRTDGFVDWRGSWRYARRIHETIDGVEELLNQGHDAEVIELLEHALRKCERALGHVDDSNGEVGVVLDRLQELHLRACCRVRPEPEALARKLFDWEMSSEWDIFHRAAGKYAEVLGASGMAKYRKLAETVWTTVPALKPGSHRDSFDHERLAITAIMETLAELSGDVDERAAVRSRDLSSGYDFLQVAEIYRQAGRHDEAMKWAEKGVKAFPERTDSRLREFLADEYHRHGRHDGAMALVWTNFSDDPSLETYQSLKQHADLAKKWPGWRDDALAAIRARLVEAGSAPRRSGHGLRNPADHSELVRIFLWEKDVDAAWREAVAGGCSGDLWMQLATRREKEHPADTVAVYQREVEHVIDGRNNSAYEAAVSLLRRVATLMALLGRTTEFESYLTDLRARHKAKRNLIALLDQAKFHTLIAPA